MLRSVRVVIGIVLLFGSGMFTTNGCAAASYDDPNTTVVVNAALKGRVFDATTKEPLAGVTVSARNQTATTDSEGRYRIDGLLSGPDTVTATADGYRAYSIPINLGRGLTNHDIYLRRP